MDENRDGEMARRKRCRSLRAYDLISEVETGFDSLGLGRAGLMIIAELEARWDKMHTYPPVTCDASPASTCACANFEDHLVSNRFPTTVLL